MARTAGKKQAPAKVEEEDEAEGWEDAVVDTDSKDAADLRLRDWRDVERFREMRDLRRLVDDDYGLEEIFHVPLKPRADTLPRPSVKLVIPNRAPAAAKPVPSSARARNEGAPPKAPVKATKAHAAAAKHHPRPVHKPVHKVKARAKRR